MLAAARVCPCVYCLTDGKMGLKGSRSSSGSRRTDESENKNTHGVPILKMYNPFVYENNAPGRKIRSMVCSDIYVIDK